MCIDATQTDGDAELERLLESDPMKMRNVFLAACASTLVLAATTDTFAQSTSDPIPGVDIIVKKCCPNDIKVNEGKEGSNVTRDNNRMGGGGGTKGNQAPIADVAQGGSRSNK